MRLRTRIGAFRALVRADARELRRDRLVGASMLTMALVLLVIHTCMWLAFSVVGDAPRVDARGLTGAAAMPVAAQLEARGVLASSAGAANVLVRSEPAAASDAGGNGNGNGNGNDDRIVIEVTEAHVGWDPVWRALRSAGVPAGQIDTLGRDGEAMPDFLRLNLGTILIAALAAISLLGTTVPLVAARGRGTLQLLGTTPLPRGLFLLSRVPNRLSLVAFSVAGVTAIALARQSMEPTGIPRFLGTVMCAIVLLFGLAALFAARASNAESSQSLMAGVCFALVSSAGAVLPVGLLPEPLRLVSGLLPGGWLVESASADLAGTTPFLPVPVSWGLMLLTGAVCFAFAARRFEWAALRGVAVPGAASADASLSSTHSPLPHTLRRSHRD
ncbi:ABC transporter permease [Leucobacter chromiireducens]|uniref:ABC transporter permease n=1 Tax=Leucobacter chromiireducens TaxID=283877 RepID=UPI003F7F16A3